MWADLSLCPSIPTPSPSGVLVSLAEWVSPQVLELQQTLAQKDQALGKLEQSLRLMEEASFDGTFLWKITNVTRRCHESACGRTVSLFSPGTTSPGAQRPARGGWPPGPRKQGEQSTLGQPCRVQLDRCPSRPPAVLGPQSW